MIYKQNIYSHANYPEIIYTNSGDDYKIEYVKAYDEAGNPYLKETGKIDIQKMINSNCPPLVNEYVQRFMYGDKNALKVRESVTYADVSNIPSLGELVAMKGEVAAAIDAINAASAAAPVAESTEGEKVNA